MKHDAAFANQTVRPFGLSLRHQSREASGPPMIRMLSAALVAGFLFAVGLAMTGSVGLVTGLAIGWCVSLAVLAVEAALYARSKSMRFASRCSAMGWSTIGAAS